MLPAGDLLGIGSGGIPGFNHDDDDIDADIKKELDDAHDRIHGLAKQAVAWHGSSSGGASEEQEEEEGPTRAIVAKPFYPDEEGGNGTAGSAASPIAGTTDQEGILQFEGGAEEVLSAGLLVWGMMVVVGGLVWV